MKKTFISITNYDDAPEFAVLGDGSVEINGEAVSDPALIVRALAENARAWQKCYDSAYTPPKEDRGNPPSSYIGVLLKGPWPALKE